MMMDKSHAYPNGAGHCDSGTAISRGHGGSSRSLSEANFGLFWGGTEIDPSAPTTVGVNMDHTLTLIRKDGSKFMGFLIRLSGQNGENVSTAALVGTETFSKYSNLCTNGVVGITHVNSMNKERVTVKLNYPAEADLLLEVTVVTNTASNWFYDSFNLNVSGDAAAPTSTVPDFGNNTTSSSSSSIDFKRLSCFLTFFILCVTTIGIYL